jgi:DNA-binding GntR family transcriptional regulator
LSTIKSFPKAGPTLEPGTLTDRICEQLKTAIVRGELAQGSKLNEPALATRYGISRGPLREALRRLEGLGLVVHVPHAGARVITLSRAEVLQIYDVREALEGMAARLAATMMTRVEVEELRELLAQHARRIAADGGRSYFQHEGDTDFHNRIACASRNPGLAQMLRGELYHRLRMYRYQSSQQSARPERALQEHEQIVDAIAERDGELAETLMRRHIQRARRAVAEQLHSRTDQPPNFVAEETR